MDHTYIKLHPAFGSSELWSSHTVARHECSHLLHHHIRNMARLNYSSWFYWLIMWQYNQWDQWVGQVLAGIHAPVEPMTWKIMSRCMVSALGVATTIKWREVIVNFRVKYTVGTWACSVVPNRSMDLEIRHLAPRTFEPVHPRSSPILHGLHRTVRPGFATVTIFEKS